MNNNDPRYDQLYRHPPPSSYPTLQNNSNMYHQQTPLQQQHHQQQQQQQQQQPTPQQYLPSANGGAYHSQQGYYQYAYPFAPNSNVQQIPQHPRPPNQHYAPYQHSQASQPQMNAHSIASPITQYQQQYVAQNNQYAHQSAADAVHGKGWSNSPQMRQQQIQSHNQHFFQHQDVSDQIPQSLPQTASPSHIQPSPSPSHAQPSPSYIQPSTSYIQPTNHQRTGTAQSSPSITQTADAQQQQRMTATYNNSPHFVNARSPYPSPSPKIHNQPGLPPQITSMSNSHNIPSPRTPNVPINPTHQNIKQSFSDTQILNAHMSNDKPPTGNTRYPQSTPTGMHSHQHNQIAQMAQTHHSSLNPTSHQNHCLPSKSILPQASRPPVQNHNNRPQSNNQERSQTKTSTPVKEEPKVHYDVLLLTLSDEYMEAAYSLSSKLTQADLDNHLELLSQYERYISMGLSCLESVLKNFNVSARIEAAIILRMVSIMFDETTNYEVMETYLSKGLNICEKNEMFDLKFSMHHLLAQVTFQRRQKVALKTLDHAIQEVETHKNTYWSYALRFLRIQLSLQQASHQEISIALQHLKKIIETSEKQNDKAIFMTALTLEAFVQLLGESLDSISNAQRSIAKIRSYQNHPIVTEISQVWAMMNCIDLLCCLVQFDSNTSSQKLSAIQEAMDDLVTDKKIWGIDGLLAIPLGPKSSDLIKDCAAQIFTKNDSGKIFLNLSWLNGIDAYAIGFLLCGITSFLKNVTEPKAATYIKEGIKFVEDQFNTEDQPFSKISPRSRTDIQRQLKQSMSIYWYLQLYQIVINCVHSEWAMALNNLFSLRKQLEIEDTRKTQVLNCWLSYINALIEQGRGNLSEARQILNSVLKQIPANSTPNKRAGLVLDDLSILCRLNLLQILHGKAEHKQLIEDIYSDLPTDSLSRHPNPAIRISYALVSATTPDPGSSSASISAKKLALQTTLAMSRASNNVQLLAIGMATLVGMFFTDIVVGDQARKSRRTARVLAGKAALPVWVAVTGGLSLQGETEIEEKNKIVVEIDGAMGGLNGAISDQFKTAVE